MSALQSVEWIALLPVLIAAGGVLAVLLADLLLPLRLRAGVLWVAVGAAALSCAASVALAVGEPRGSFCAAGLDAPRCAYVVDERVGFVLALFSAAALVCLLLSAPEIRGAAVPPGEYCLLILSSLTGALVLAGARDFATLVVGLETLTVPLYIAVAFRRRDTAGGEAAITFLVVSVAASAVLLLGVALLYGLTGTMDFGALTSALAGDTALRDVPLTSAAVAMVLVGLAFKLAAVPFHTWAPSTYQGAPLPVAAYLSTVSKAGGIAGLFAVLPAMTAYSPVWARIIAALAVLSMTVGNLIALRQNHLVRLLAWSGVAQTGYLLVGLAVLGHQSGPEAVSGAGATLAYLAVYVVMTLGAFGCLVAMESTDGNGRAAYDLTIDRLRGLGRRRPWVGLTLAFFMLGLAGLPPALLGLVGKVVVLRAAFDGDAAWLGIAVAVNTVLGLVYYLRVAAAVFAPADRELAGRRTRVSTPVVVAVGGLAVAGVVLGFAPDLLFGVTPLLAR